MVFPGSNCLYYYYQFLLNSNSDDIYQTIKFIQNLKYIDHNNSQQKFLNIKRFFEIQYQIFYNLNGKLNQQQRKYYQLLSKFIQTIRDETNITLIQQESTNLSKFLNSYLDHSAKIFFILKPLFQDILFGLEYCQQQILLKNPNSTREIIKYNNNSIDCLYILKDPKGPTVLFCNPNGVYYENFYQNFTTKKMYKQKNFNLIFWNYCGYGFSTGTLSTKNLIDCGLFIAQYFQNKYKIKTLGVHGYSLGGMIATEIAYKLNLSFLVADRTFSSLGQTASIMFNFSYMKLILYCLVNWDYPNYLSYYNFKGPKIIIQDANDEMIPYQAQLQTSLVRLFFTNTTQAQLYSKFYQESKQYLDFFFQKILSKAQTNSLIQSLQILINCENHNNNGKNHNNKIQSNNQQKYKEFVELLSQIEYCNNNIFQVINQNPTSEKIALFFGSCFIFEQNFIISIKKILARIQKFLNQNSAQYNELNQDHIPYHEQLILKTIVQIVKNFKSTKQIQKLQEIKKKKTLFNLIAIHCGHNENIGLEDEKKLQDFLMSNLII
ncbi:unnamed protein product [Paramecium sonneborni]|uniref:Uncharacterized protein n=1 Tax=Paramecium sonneborni TaxID=65129 RepID=A0A8S1Q148_9CILI|nr:unnamed protein product [Paramecium sonneborni]